MKKPTQRQNEKGFALIWTYVVLVGLMIMLSGFYASSAAEMKHAAFSTDGLKAFYLAESAIDRKLVELSNNNTGSFSQQFGSGTLQAAYDVNTKMITATGTYGGMTRTLTAIAENSSLTNLPPGVKAGLSVPAALTVIQAMVIDGREHNPQGGLTSDPGTYGIAFGEEPVLDGDILPRIGGLGYAPAYPVPPEAKLLLDPAQIEDLMSPEAVLGLEPGDLDPYKHTVPPSEPLDNEIYYYSPFIIPSVVVDIDLGGGSGILIVGNSTQSQWVEFSGDFTGLIICNNCMFDVKATVIGALVSVNPNVSEIHGPIGSALWDFAKVKFSTEVLLDLLNLLDRPPEWTLKHWSDGANSGFNRLNASS